MWLTYSDYTRYFPGLMYAKKAILRVGAAPLLLDPEFDCVQAFRRHLLRRFSLSRFSIAIGDELRRLYFSYRKVRRNL